MQKTSRSFIVDTITSLISLGIAAFIVLALLTIGDYSLSFAKRVHNLIAVSAQQPVTISNSVIAVCDDPASVTSANISLSAGTGNTELVSISGSDVIYVCGFELIAGGSGDVAFIVGTGTACATSPTTKQTLGFTTDILAVNTPNHGAVQFKSSTGQALCVSRASSVTLKGIVIYVRRAQV
jgi:hypothetical protein